VEKTLKDFGSVAAMVDESLADDRFTSLLLSLFAGVAAASEQLKCC
jgi:hypothetical protein